MDYRRGVEALGFAHGPIFIISLGFHLRFDGMATGNRVFLTALTAAIAAGQVLSAGPMARRISMSWTESWTVGVGMCGPNQGLHAAAPSNIQGDEDSAKVARVEE